MHIVIIELIEVIGYIWLRNLVFIY